MPLISSSSTPIPAVDVRNFAKVSYTIRAGKIIYKK